MAPSMVWLIIIVLIYATIKESVSSLIRGFSLIAVAIGVTFEQINTLNVISIVLATKLDTAKLLIQIFAPYILHEKLRYSNRTVTHNKFLWQADVACKPYHTITYCLVSHCSFY